MKAIKFKESEGVRLGYWKLFNLVLMYWDGKFKKGLLNNLQA